MDRILRFERLNEEWRSLSEDLFGEPVDLPRTNRAKGEFLSVEELSQTDRDFIADVYREDFEVLGYPR